MFHQPIAISTTSSASALLVLSLTFDFSSTNHRDHFQDASFFSKKHFLVKNDQLINECNCSSPWKCVIFKVSVSLIHLP